MSTYLRELRFDRRLSQASVATQIGISAAMLSNLEMGKVAALKEQQLTISRFYNMDVREIFDTYGAPKAQTKPLPSKNISKGERGRVTRERVAIVEKRCDSLVEFVTKMNKTLQNLEEHFTKPTTNPNAEGFWDGK